MSAALALHSDADGHCPDGLFATFGHIGYQSHFVYCTEVSWKPHDGFYFDLLLVKYTNTQRIANFEYLYTLLQGLPLRGITFQNNHIGGYFCPSSFAKHL